MGPKAVEHQSKQKQQQKITSKQGSKKLGKVEQKSGFVIHKNGI